MADKWEAHIFIIDADGMIRQFRSHHKTPWIKESSHA
jgi:hypothetical protein